LDRAQLLCIDTVAQGDEVDILVPEITEGFEATLNAVMSSLVKRNILKV
jgi:hypothetical protein